MQAGQGSKLFENPEKLNDTVLYKEVMAPEGSDARKLGDQFVDKFPQGILLMFAPKGEKASVLLKAHRKSAPIDCADILKTALATVGSKGGGKADMAQGSISSKDVDSLKTTIKDLILSKLQ